MSYHPFKGDRFLEMPDGQKREVPLEQASVYTFFDADGNALYVGCSVYAVQRFQAHSKKVWWTDVASVTVEHFECKRDAQAYEQFEISRLLPRYNVVGIPGRVLQERRAAA